MKNIVKLSVAAVLALGLGTSAYAGGDSQVSAPVSASVTVPTVTIVVSPSGGTSVNGAPVTVASLPPQAQTAIAQIAAAGGGSITSASPMVVGLLASYF
ncbi:MAG: hypothetical protein N4A61_06395 [Pelagimonas sp.]|jgi:guanyl-specific ribonuclease Sa|nr:hypothetical protein [Pelagimonas sp.]